MKVDKEFILDDYAEGGMDGTYGEYLELVIQYGYMVLFGFAFPLAIVLATINNIFEIQVDKYKLVSLVKRPIPQGAATIGMYIYIYIYILWLIYLGIWRHILNIISFIGVVSNVGLITITLNMIDNENTKYMTFIGLIILLLIIKFGIDAGIADVPGFITTVIKRHKVIKERLMRGMKINCQITSLMKMENEKEIPKHHVD